MNRHNNTSVPWWILVNSWKILTETCKHYHVRYNEVIIPDLIIFCILKSVLYAAYHQAETLHYITVTHGWLPYQQCLRWQLNLMKSFYQIFSREKRQKIAVNFMLSVKCAVAIQNAARLMNNWTIA